jgi:hypothetical protein
MPFFPFGAKTALFFVRVRARRFVRALGLIFSSVYSVAIFPYLESNPPERIEE